MDETDSRAKEGILGRGNHICENDTKRQNTNIQETVMITGPTWERCGWQVRMERDRAVSLKCQARACDLYSAIA